MTPDALCVDCGQRKGLFPGYVIRSSVEVGPTVNLIRKVCQKCHNFWRPFMHFHPPDEECPHCAWCKTVCAEKEQSLTTRVDSTS